MGPMGEGKSVRNLPSPKLHQTSGGTVQLGGKSGGASQGCVELGPVFLYLSIDPL